MAPSFARLCLPYVAATALLRARSKSRTSNPQAYRSGAARAGGVRVLRDANPSLNALAPQRVEIGLQDGVELAMDLPAVLGARRTAAGPRPALARVRACRDLRACGRSPMPAWNA
jgi:hypothetical protein